MPHIAIIGGGVAAHTVLKTLLASHNTSDEELIIDIFSSEPHPPYRRPSVNKEMLLEGKTPADVALPAGIFETPGVTLHLNTPVIMIDTGTQTLSAGNKTYGFDSLVFATGSGPRLLAEEWLDSRDTHYIRTPEHSAALRGQLTELGPEDSVVVIGGGVLGLEAAAAAAVLSQAQVQVLELAGEVCSRILPPTAARWLRERHREHGVTITCGVNAASLSDEIDRINPAIVIVSIGAVRDTMLAEDAGLAVGDGLGGGIIVDDYGRTANPRIFAVGDCAEIHTRDGRIVRPEDEGSARTLASIVGNHLAADISGTVDNPESPRPSFSDTPQKGWTKQYDQMLNILGITGLSGSVPGHENLAEHVVLTTDEELVVYTMSGSTVVGITTVGRSPEVRAAKSALGTTLAE